MVKNAMISASEAECADLYINTRQAILVKPPYWSSSVHDISKTHIRGNGTSKLGHINASGKLNVRWNNEKQNIAKTFQGNVQALLMGEG